MEEILARGWDHFVERSGGTMSLRFFIQPTISGFLGVRAGLKDAREGRPAFFWSLIKERGLRQKRIGQVSKDVRNVLILASILDITYQLIEFRAVYFLELVFTSLVLAVIPYLLIRGPINRIASWMFKKQEGTSHETN
jgi:hypothetical protein